MKQNETKTCFDMFWYAEEHRVWRFGNTFFKFETIYRVYLGWFGEIRFGGSLGCKLPDDQ